MNDSTESTAIETIADLDIGDTLHLPDRSVIVTALIPATRWETLLVGTREVQSGTWWETYDADQPCKATPWEYAAQGVQA